MSAVTNIWNILLRIVATFAASGLAVIGAGAIAGISTIKAVTVAGLTAVAAVVERLARAFMDDGKLDIDEINAAFSQVDPNSKTVAEAELEETSSQVSEVSMDLDAEEIEYEGNEYLLDQDGNVYSVDEQVLVGKLKDNKIEFY